MAIQPIRVIHCIPSLARSGGGPPLAVVPLCEFLAAEGIRVHLLTVRRGGEQALRPDPELVPCTAVKGYASPRFRLSWAPSFKCALRRLIDETGAQVIHNHALWLPVNHAAASIAREKHLPLLTTPHGMLTRWSVRHKGWKKRLALRLYQRRDLQTARAIHATSALEAADLRALGFRRPIAMIPLDLTLPPWQEPGPLFGAPRTVLFLSRLHPKKGLLNLVQAWSTLRPDNWRLVIAGPDELGHRAEVEAAVRACRLDAAVSIRGPVEGEAKWDLYRRADLFVLPTYSENFGIVVPEALASGVPVITTQGTPWEELVSHRCGWWIGLGVEPLTEERRTALAMPDEERRAMGRRGRRLVEDQYGWHRIAGQMREVYAWV